LKEIHIYTDGGCSGNPGPGAWAYIILLDDTKICKSGGERATTNNRMELGGIIQALHDVATLLPAQKTEEPHFKVFTDSMYVKKGITEWIKTWEKNGWKNAAKQPVKNQDLWVELKRLADQFHIQWQWVRGHHDNKLNNECDELVQVEIKNIINGKK
jgi:ribonuclease HI